MPAPTRLSSILAAALIAASLVPARTSAEREAPQAVVMSPAPAAASVPPAGTAIVSGVVLDAGTHAPVSGAVVYLGLAGRGRAAPQSRQITDSQGRFVFVEVPASDRLTLSVSRAGYMDGGYTSDGNEGSAGGRLAVADGQWVSNVRIELAKRGAISGAVFDEHGEPVVGVLVRLIAMLPIAGRVRLAAGPLATTDDRGMYRIVGLAPGRYLVSVPSVQAAVPAQLTSAEIAGLTAERIAQARSRGQTPTIPAEQAVDAGPATRVVLGPYPIAPPRRDGQALAYPIAFHPAATNVAAAAAIELAPGESRSQVDIRLTPVPAGEVAGRVEGEPAWYANLNVRLLPAGLEELGLGSEAATALVAADGTFRFANVPAGSYVVDAPVAVGEYQFGQFDTFGQPFGRPPGVRGSGSYSDSIGIGPAGTTYKITTLDGARPASGRVAVTVSATEATTVRLPLKQAGWITGHFRFELDPNRPDLTGPTWASVRAEPADASAALGLPRASGDRSDPSRSFALEGMRPGLYLLRAELSPGFQVKSIAFRGADYTHTPFDFTAADGFEGVVITATSAVAGLGGFVRDRQGGPAVRVRVVVFSADRARWATPGYSPPDVRSTSTNNLGMYRFESLPAGDYYVVAIAAPQTSNWGEPGFFERAAAVASRVTLRWGETGAQDLVPAVIR
jgi:hypothetical protein